MKASELCSPSDDVAVEVGLQAQIRRLLVRKSPPISQKKATRQNLGVRDFRAGNVQQNGQQKGASAKAPSLATVVTPEPDFLQARRLYQVKSVAVHARDTPALDRSRSRLPASHISNSTRLPRDRMPRFDVQRLDFPPRPILWSAEILSFAVGLLLDIGCSHASLNKSLRRWKYLQIRWAIGA